MKRSEIEDMFLPFVQKHVNVQKMIRLFWIVISMIRPVKGIKIMDENWDYLIILDACRYDYFEKFNNMIEGHLEKKISSSSCTYEWLEKNFSGKKFPDTIYITANPRIHTGWFKKWVLKNKNPFYHIEDVWKYKWDEELETVLPNEMNDVVKKMIKKYPYKRMIIHYLQPHPPYIDKDGNKIITSKSRTPLRKGEISRKMAIDAYIRNLKLVLNAVKNLLENLNGKIIITADHGECFGEWLLFSHPGKTYVKELVEIPWFSIRKDDNEKVRINRGIRKFIKKEKTN